MAGHTMSILETVGAKTLSATRYPSPLLALLSATPYDLRIRKGSGVSIGPGNVIRGDVDIGDDVSIAPDNRVQGTVSLGRDGRIGTGNAISGSVDLGSEFFMGNRNRLEGTVRVREYATVGEDGVIDGTVDVGRFSTLRETTIRGEVTLGQFCMLAPEVVFQQRNHDMYRPAVQEKLYDELLGEKKTAVTDGPIEVGHDVWFGRRAIVLSGVEIGHGAVVGAGAVVTDDVEPYAVVTGVPAERVGWRFDAETRERLLDLQWWEWSTEEIREREPFFRAPVDRALERHLDFDFDLPS